MASGKCQMAEGVLQGAEGELKTGNEQREAEKGCPDPVVGYHSNRVIDDSTNDKIGILSHEGRDSADRVWLGDGHEQSPACGVKTPQKAPNEAKSESAQSNISQRVESENGEPEWRERSQSAGGGEVVHDAGDDRVKTIAPADEGGGNDRRHEGHALNQALISSLTASFLARQLTAPQELIGSHALIDKMEHGS